VAASLTGSLVDVLVDGVVERSFGWLVDWLDGKILDRLIGPLVYWFMRCCSIQWSIGRPVDRMTS